MIILNKAFITQALTVNDNFGTDLKVSGEPTID